MVLSIHSNKPQTERTQMNTYETLATEYNSKIKEIVNNSALTPAEKLNRQVEIKLAYEEPLAKAFLASLFA